MSEITFGKIIPRHDDDRRGLIWDALKPLRWRGYERGVFIVEIDASLSIKVELSSMDISVLHQIDGLLERVVEANGRVVAALALSEDLDDLLDVAWIALSPVRSVGYGSGQFELNIPGGYTLCYRVTKWDARLVRRLDDLFSRIAAENSDGLERALSVEATSTAA